MHALVAALLVRLRSVVCVGNRGWRRRLLRPGDGHPLAQVPLMSFDEEERVRIQVAVMVSAVGANPFDTE